MNEMLLASAREAAVARWSEVLDKQGNGVAQTVRALESHANANPEALVLLDLSLPELGNVSGVQQLKARFPHLKVFCFSDQPSDTEGLALLTAGVCGYANTFMHPDSLRQALQVVESGQVWLGQRLMQALIQRTAQQATPVESNPALGRLTAREREIAEVLAGGASNKIIARKLDITERTVKAHLTSIFEKTGTHDRLELALLVQGRGQAARGTTTATSAF